MSSLNLRGSVEIQVTLEVQGYRDHGTVNGHYYSIGFRAALLLTRTMLPYTIPHPTPLKDFGL